jgi:hypothetical protein
MTRVKDFDASCKEGNYIVKNGSEIVYDNRTGAEKEYYRIYMKFVHRITEHEGCFVLHVK